MVLAELADQPQVQAASASSKGYDVTVLYTQAKLHRSIFLAGPTPRSADVPSWRPEAIRILEGMPYWDGDVIVPEPAPGGSWPEREGAQIAWEWLGLHTASVVAFWVPRNMRDMPGLTTNTEFGLMCATGKAVYGRPPKAEKCDYLDALARRSGVPIHRSLESLLYDAVARTSMPGL